MSNFETAVEKVLEHEGGYVDHANDPGGATNYGISLRFVKQSTGIDLDVDGDGDIDADDIKAMTPDQAKEIYKTEFWEKYGYDMIENSDVATKIFDMCVNMGPRQAHKLVQRACNAATNSKDLVEDGILGNKSFEAVNEIGLALTSSSASLLDPIREVQSNFYKTLAEKKPKLQVFLKGWLRRANS